MAFSTWNADLRVGTGTVTVDPVGRYVVHARARGERGEGDAIVDLIVTPAPGAYFPGAALGGDGFVSGYAVAGLRADAIGTICVRDVCERYDGAQAYHDHNWGVWRGVTWEWGAARAGSYTFLYGRVQPPDSASGDTPLFFYLVDSLGFRTLFRPQAHRLYGWPYDPRRTVAMLRVPSRGGVRGRARERHAARRARRSRTPSATDTRDATGRSVARRWRPGRSRGRTSFR